MNRHSTLLTFVLAVGLAVGSLASHASMRAHAQDSMLPASATINSQTLTDALTSAGTTRVTLCPASVSPGLCPCITGNWINTSAATIRLTVRSMPRGVVVRTFLIPATPGNATMDSVQTMFGDSGGSSLTMETDAGGGAGIVFAGSYWYRQGGN